MVRVARPALVEQEEVEEEEAGIDREREEYQEDGSDKEMFEEGVCTLKHINIIHFILLYVTPYNLKHSLNLFNCIFDLI